MSDRSRRLRELIDALARLARAEIDRHPHGHLLSGHKRVRLEVELPLDLDLAALDDLGAKTDAALHESLEALLRHASVFRPGSLHCLRCDSAACEHAAPRRSRDVFAAYGPTGTPVFSDFAALLLERRHARLEDLYSPAAPLIVDLLDEAALSGRVLPAFRDRTRGYRILGQAIAGFYRIPDRSGRPEPLAITVQLVCTTHQDRRKQQRRRYGVNLLAAGPHDEPLDRALEALGAIPWSLPLRWLTDALGALEAEERRRPLSEEKLASRAAGLLAGFARRLERGQRGRDRRTLHAEMRHESGERPTRMALADLGRATPEQMLFDTRKKTLVVLGDRGRAHLFSLQGKLVTSIRYEPQVLERRRRSGVWRPAESSESAALQALLAASRQKSDGSGR